MEEQKKSLKNIDTMQEKLIHLESQKKRIRIISIIISIVYFTVCLIIAILNKKFGSTNTEISLSQQFILYLVVIILSIFAGTMSYYILIIRIDDKISLIKFSIDTEKQLENEENLYSKSIKMNFRYLDNYYSQTQNQASKGFIVTVVIATVGAFIVFGGIFSMYFGFTKPAYITVATGSVTEIIASVFFYLYNKTIINMGKYHEKLVLSQNVAYALEIVDTLSMDKKDEAKKELMLELVKDINIYLHHAENK